MCAMIKRGTFYPVKTIVGKDLDVGATWNADMNPIPPMLIPAGRIMIYLENTRVMSPWDGAFGSITDVLPTGGIVGILAQDTDSTPTLITGGVNVNTVGMIYRRGTFLRQEIEEANYIDGANSAAGFGSVAGINFLEVLRRKGINLEWSFEGYGLIERPPNPIPPNQP